MTEIETVTVTLEEFKANLSRFLWVKRKKRVVVTHEGEEVAVIGVRLPGEKRSFPSQWFFDEIDPPEPFDPDDPEPLTRAVLEDRGRWPTETPPPSPSSS